MIFFDMRNGSGEKRREGMDHLKSEIPEGTHSVFGRVLNRDLFLFLLDLEVKRARRYQNFLCLMLLNIKPRPQNDNGWNSHICYETLSDLLALEMRESDILGSLAENKLVVILPYADVKAGNHAKSRFEDTLKYYDFKKKGFEVMIDQICFPTHGTDAAEMIKKALETET